MVRVHEPVSIMDWLDVQSDGHSWPLTAAMHEIQANGVGVILLLNANESPDDLIEIATQKEHVARHSEATPEADWRTFGIGAQLLLDLRVSRMKVLGNQRRFPSLGGFGLQAESFVSYQP